MPSTKRRGTNPASKTQQSYRYRGRDYPTLGFIIQTHAEVLGLPQREVEALDLAIADSAAHKPVLTVGGDDAYPGHFAKVAAIGYTIARCHAFPDGNKRTAFLCMLMTLSWSGHHLSWDEQLVITIMSLVASGELTQEGLRKALLLGCGLDPNDPNAD